MDTQCKSDTIFAFIAGVLVGIAAIVVFIRCVLAGDTRVEEEEYVPTASPA